MFRLKILFIIKWKAESKALYRCVFQKFPRPDKSGEKWRDARPLHATVCFFLNCRTPPPAFSSLEISMAEDHGGPPQYQFELLALPQYCLKPELSKQRQLRSCPTICSHS